MSCTQPTRSSYISSSPPRRLVIDANFFDSVVDHNSNSRRKDNPFRLHDPWTSLRESQRCQSRAQTGFRCRPKPAAAFRFLSLPREVRDEIYRYLLLSRAKTSFFPNGWASSEAEPKLKKRVKIFHNTRYLQDLAARKNAIPMDLAILGVNRQLHGEGMEILLKENTIAITAGHLLDPDWVNNPFARRALEISRSIHLLISPFTQSPNLQPMDGALAYLADILCRRTQINQLTVKFAKVPDETLQFLCIDELVSKLRILIEPLFQLRNVRCVNVQSSRVRERDQVVAGRFQLLREELRLVISNPLEKADCMY